MAGAGAAGREEAGELSAAARGRGAGGGHHGHVVPHLGESG